MELSEVPFAGSVDRRNPIIYVANAQLWLGIEEIFSSERLEPIYNRSALIRLVLAQAL
jgi:hypothetical protein